MIDTGKLNFDALADIVFDVQRRERYRFELDDIAEIIRYTVRKADLNHKDADYVPLLFENELRDHVMRKRINEMGRRNLCATSVCTALA